MPSPEPAAGALAVPTAGRWRGAAARGTDALRAWFTPERTFELVLTMSLIVMLVDVIRTWYLETPVTVLALAGLLFRPLARHPAYWFALALALTAGHVRLWVDLDNHKYLQTYWAVALGCALLAPDPAAALRTAARYLLGLCFLFATLWKVIAAGYVDGGFFHWLLLADARFAGLATGLGGAPGPALAANVEAIRAWTASGDLAGGLTLTGGPRVGPLAAFLTWWTLLYEALVAAAFLWPRDRGLSKYRDAILLVFLFTTYAPAPVRGFGWVLAAMGLAQTTSRSALVRPLYVAAFLAIQFYVAFPFGRFLLPLASRLPLP